MAKRFQGIEVEVFQLMRLREKFGGERTTKCSDDKVEVRVGWRIANWFAIIEVEIDEERTTRVERESAT